jgi:hypothetical protein
MPRDLPRLTQDVLRAFDIESVPLSAHSSRHRAPVDLSGEVWDLSFGRSNSLKWRDLEAIDPLLLHLMKLYFAESIESLSSDTVYKNFRRAVQMFGEMDVRLASTDEADWDEFADTFDRCVLESIDKLTLEAIARMLGEHFYGTHYVVQYGTQLITLAKCLEIHADPSIPDGTMVKPTPSRFVPSRSALEALFSDAGRADQILRDNELWQLNGS